MRVVFPNRPQMRHFEIALLTHSWKRKKGENNVPRNIKHKALYNCITFSLQSSLKKKMKMCFSIINVTYNKTCGFFKCQSVESYFNITFVFVFQL